ncbi:MAG: LmeA family phospholipid-binding protein [Solirubrobacteraceae bacterium]|jgi:hypothetical protein
MRRLAVLALGAPALVVLALALAQLLLPGIAAQRLRERLARSGQVLAVQVRAFPAIELLWHHADRVVIRLGTYHAATAGRLGGSLDQAGNVGSLQASARQVDAGLLTLHDATLSKRGDELNAGARITEADLRAALPILRSVTPVASGDGRLTLRGTAGLLGVTATVDATVSVRDGRVVVAPDVPLGSLATITVFADPHISVQSVSASAVPGGFAVRGTARLH